MAPTSFSHTTRVPLPAHLPPQLVLDALHAYEPLIVADPFFQHHERRPVELASLVADAFFREDGRRLAAYEVHQRVPVFAGLTTAVRVPCVFQSYDRGVRCRSDASAGVTVRTSWEVRRRGEVPRAPNELGGAAEQGKDGGPGGPRGVGVPGEWELVEVAQIECGSLVKPFVKRGFNNAHVEILHKIVDDISKLYEDRRTLQPEQQYAIDPRR